MFVREEEESTFFDDVRSRRVILDQTNTDQVKRARKPQAKRRGTNKWRRLKLGTN
jgi:hypothetical protein